MRPDDPDLFDFADRYPHAPGFKEGETSREAAEAMAPLAGRLRKLVYDFICRHPGHTADEIAAALDESILTIRPRVSELRCRGWIRNQGRGVNRSGKEAHRWWRATS
jgi:broad specificity phosphatase PhoE